MTNRAATRIAPVLVSLWLAPAALAQAPEQEPATEQATRDEAEERDRKRILHLEGGTLVRARTRRVEGLWEYRAKGAWKPLPAGAVTRVVDERRVLDQARDLERDIPTGEPVRRVALADWMVAQGLVEEALAQLDQVLRAEPGQADAIRMLQNPAPALQVFRSRQSADDLMREACGASPAVRELALARLAELESEAALHERYRESLGSHSHRLRALAAQGLGRQFPGEEVKGLLVRSVLDGSEDVRREAAVALGEAGEPAVVIPLLRAMGSDYAAVRENAIQAVGNAGYPAAVPALMSHMTSVVSAVQSGGGGGGSPRSNIFVGKQIAYIQDFDVEVAQFEAVADPQINVLLEGAVLDVRVHGVHVESFAVESRKMRTALAQLTGANPGKTNRAWLDWWRENQGDYTGAEPPPRTAVDD
jgi:hypothetical protein